MAGLCAAASAAQAGANVLVVEKAPSPGGSMRMSGGTVWTAPSRAVMEANVPGGSRERQRRLVDGLSVGLAWLEGLGVTLGSKIENPWQTGREVDVEEVTVTLEKTIRGLEGRVMVETALESLERDDLGVTGAVARRADGEAFRIAARAVILATGGFQGNPALVSKHITPFANRMLLRANPWSAGDGLRAALAVGAGTSQDMAWFYGHTMPAEPAASEPARWTSVTQYASQDAILVDRQGLRFFDESRSLFDERAAPAIARQPEARAFMLVDNRLYGGDALPDRSLAEMRPNFDRAIEAGAPHAVADDLPTLAAHLAGLGMNSSGLVAELTEFNTAVAGGHGGGLRVPRTRRQFGLIERPFRALEVRPGITFTLGGIRVGADGRVHDPRGEPIAGLWAAGADGGGTYVGGYMGGLVLGLVQGRDAGHAAARLSR
jgi:fumarate reductase flavoprotein subunit